MKLILQNGPSLTPLSVDELALHLRIDEYDSDSGTELESIIDSGNEIVEDITSRKLLTQTWNYYIDAFPDKNYIKIPFGNLQSVTHVKYTNSSGVQTTMAVTTDYIVETNGDQCGRIVLPYSKTWPSFTAYSSNPIVMRFICGWTSASVVPEKIKSAIKLICGELYLNRENYRIDNAVYNLLSSSILRDTFI